MNAKTLMNGLKKIGWQKEFFNWCGANVDFRKTNNSVSIFNIHCLLVCLNDHFNGCDSFEKDELKMVFYEALKFFVCCLA